MRKCSQISLAHVHDIRLLLASLFILLLEWRSCSSLSHNGPTKTILAHFPKQDEPSLPDILDLSRNSFRRLYWAIECTIRPVSGAVGNSVASHGSVKG